MMTKGVTNVPVGIGWNYNTYDMWTDWCKLNALEGWQTRECFECFQFIDPEDALAFKLKFGL